jgi:hypothetical protein
VEPYVLNPQEKWIHLQKKEDGLFGKPKVNLSNSSRTPIETQGVLWGCRGAGDSSGNGKGAFILVRLQSS